MAKSRKIYKLRRYRTRRNKIKRNKRTLRKGLRKRRKTKKKNLRGGALSAETVNKRINDAQEQIKNIHLLNKDQLENLKNILDSTSDEIAKYGIKFKSGDKMGQKGVNKQQKNLEEIIKKIQEKLDNINNPATQVQPAEEASSGKASSQQAAQIDSKGEATVEQPGAEITKPQVKAAEIQPGLEIAAPENDPKTTEEGLEKQGLPELAAQEESSVKKCEEQHGTVVQLTDQVKEVIKKIDGYLECIEYEKKKKTDENKEGGKKPRKRTRKRRRKKRR